MAHEQALVMQATEKMRPFEDPVLLAALQSVLEDRPSVVQELADWMIPDRAYASSRLLQDNRLSGTIKSYSEAKGYGFIDCPEVKEAFGSDVFLHHSQVTDYAIGQEVSFAILMNKERKPQAFDLGPVQGGKDMKKASGKGVASKGAAGGKASQWMMPGAVKGGWAPSLGPWGASADASWMGGWDASWKGGWEDSWKGAWGAGAAKGWSAGPGFGKGKSTAAPRGGKGPPPETSAEMEGVTDQRWEGFIKSFNESRGFGFIQCDELKERFGADVFLHTRQYQGHIVGEHVSFEVFLNKDGKPQAKELAGADGEPGAKKMKFA